MDYTVLIPAYNEAQPLAELLPGLLTLSPKVLVVDDGSTDGTAKVAERLGARVVRHGSNRGKGSAIITGLRAASTELVVIMDGDGQHDPRDAPRLARELSKGFDMVIGDRFSGDSAEMPLHRRIANSLIRGLLSTAGVNDPLSGYRALRRSRFAGLSEAGYETEMEMVLHAKRKRMRVREIPIRVRYKGLEARPKTGLGTYARLLSFALRGRLG